MRLRKRATAIVLCAIGASVAVPQATLAQCACNADLVGVSSEGPTCEPDGIISIGDMSALFECIEAQADVRCGRPLEVCDINCDGIVDLCDFGALLEAFRNQPDPCGVACGACCQTEREKLGPCQNASLGACDHALVQGTFVGEGTVCGTPTPCDCQPNGVPDDEDISTGTSTDDNSNGMPDECEPGACCFILLAGQCVGGPLDGQPCADDSECFGLTCLKDDLQSCAPLRQSDCELPPRNGTWRGPRTECPEQNVAFIREGDGSIFIHIIGPPVECPTGGEAQKAQGVCTGPPYQDAWVSSTGGTMCHNFDTGGAIPADFFGPGSDPFTDTVCLQGLPLGLPGLGDADTLIERSADPFDRCELPSATQETVGIEIVALSLESIDPVTVTFNGGQDPEAWDLFVDLAPGGPLVGTPASTLTATKTHCNGGNYTSILHVQPRFTFTKVAAPGTVQVFDTEQAGIPAIPLLQDVAMPWVSDVDPDLGAMVDLCTDFHPGIEETNPTETCDCNTNGVRDKCDVESDPTIDCNANASPDVCDIASNPSLDANQNGVIDACEIDIPTVSQWGLVAITLLMLTAGTMVIRRRREATAGA